MAGVWKSVINPVVHQNVSNFARRIRFHCRLVGWQQFLCALVVTPNLAGLLFRDCHCVSISQVLAVAVEKSVGAPWVNSSTRVISNFCSRGRYLDFRH